MGTPDRRGDRTTFWGLLVAAIVIGTVAGFGLYRRPAGGTTRPPYSVVQFLAVCEKAESGPDGIDLRNVITEVPPGRASVTVAVCLLPDRPGRKFRLERSTSGGRNHQERDLGDNLEPHRASIRTVAFDPVEVSEGGEIRFLVTCDGSPMVWRVVPVRASRSQG